MNKSTFQTPGLCNYELFPLGTLGKVLKSIKCDFFFIGREGVEVEITYRLLKPPLVRNPIMVAKILFYVAL